MTILESIDALITRGEVSPDLERIIAWATLTLAAATVLAHGLDWISPRLADLASRLGERAKSTPSDADDRVARILARLAVAASTTALLLAGLADMIRGVVPRGRVTVGRPTPPTPPAEGSP